MFGTEGARKSLFIRTGLTPLTCSEKRVSSLLSKGLNQHDISRLTGINAKTVSSHLRSSMTKFKVKTLLEYRVKLSHINTLHCFN
ncbi:LuxR C-terminal-related transcriptional regulator [Rahnella sp. R3(2024)]|uniref:LuxR C-terminal-related transcriptional regulator n=1 Tax=Rahnella sp. R3(2024) TaxID=3163550 RepID=UPI0036E0CE1B